MTGCLLVHSYFCVNEMKFFFSILLFSLVSAQCISQTPELFRQLEAAAEDTSKARLLRNLGWKYLLIDADSSMMFYQQSYELSIQLNDYFGEVLGLLNIAGAHCRRGETDKCLLLLHEAKRISVKNNDIKLIATSYGRLASHYSKDVHRPDSALIYFGLSEEAHRKWGDVNSLWMLYLHRGEFYFQMAMLDKAEADLVKAYELTQQSGTRIDQAMVLHRLVRNYFDLGQWEKYSKYSEAYIKFINEGSSQNKLQDDAHRVLYFFEDNENPGAAIPTLEKIQQVHEKKQHWLSAIDALKFLAVLKTKNGQVDQAIADLERAAGLAAKYGYLLELEVCYHRLYQLAESNNRSGHAFAYFKQYKSIQDSIEVIDNQKMINELEVRYATQKKDEQIVVQGIELERQQLAKRNLLLIVCLLIMLALATLVFLYSKYKANLALKEKKATIEKTLGEKELLLREIHHRVKNNLQVISSLLNLQSRYINDEKAIAAIKDGRNRVNSMSLIHQNLYLNESLTTIDLGLYLQKLSDSLFQSYNIDPSRIRLDTNVQQVRLDVDTLIPLGLILNELLSNALKHAFPDERAGEVLVRFEESGENYFLEVKDNGVGMDGKSPESLQESFGIQMVKAFTQKLKASVEFKTMNGVTASLVIPKAQPLVS